MSNITIGQALPFIELAIIIVAIAINIAITLWLIRRGTRIVIQEIKEEFSIDEKLNDYIRQEAEKQVSKEYLRHDWEAWKAEHDSKE